MLETGSRRRAHYRILVGVIAVASPATASPRVAGGLDYTVARGGGYDEMHLGWRLEAGGFLQLGHWHATGSFAAHMHVRSDATERDGPDLGGWSAGGRLAYQFRLEPHGMAFIALGVERVWINGQTAVVRGCREANTCIAGFYTEVPDYDAWTPQLRVGVGPAFDDPTMVLAGTFELIVEPMRLWGVPPGSIFDVAVYGAFTFSVGGGR